MCGRCGQILAKEDGEMNFADLPREKQEELVRRFETANQLQGKMCRNELNAIVREMANRVGQMFSVKQEGYGQDEDGLHNFRASAKRIYGEATHENMLKVLQTLQDKHLVALANRGLGDKEFEERCLDVAVYSFIAVGILREARRLA